MRQTLNFLGMSSVTWLQYVEGWGDAVKKMSYWPLIQWLTPGLSVSLAMRDGRTVGCVEKNGVGVVLANVDPKSKFKGAVLPDELVLWRTVSMPKLGGDELRGALALDVMGASPFSPEDLIWLHTPPLRDGAGMKTAVCLVSRKIVNKYLATHQTTPNSPDAFEVWVQSPDQVELMMVPGFGEKFRQKLSGRGQRINISLIALLTALGMAMAITPTWQLRLRALQAVQDYAQLQSRAAPAVKNREQLLLLETQLEQIKTQIDKSIQPEVALASLTQFMPDDAYLTGLQMQGNKITLIGLAPNAALLMQKLSAQAGVKEVRAPTAAIKARGTDRENFNIELTLGSVQGGVKP